MWHVEGIAVLVGGLEILQGVANTAGELAIMQGCALLKTVSEHCCGFKMAQGLYGSSSLYLRLATVMAIFTCSGVCQIFNSLSF